MGVDEMGVDEMGVDEMGVDEMGVDEMGVDELGVDELGVDEMGVDEMGVDEDRSRDGRPSRGVGAPCRKASVSAARRATSDTPLTIPSFLRYNSSTVPLTFFRS
jgi:hypothetical protein